MTDDAAALTKLSLLEQMGGVRAGDVSFAEVVNSHLQEIDQYDDTLRAFISVNRDATNAAAAIDSRHDRLDLPLLGAVVSIKDIFDEESMPNTAGRHPDLVSVAERDSTVVARLKQAGAVIIGRTNLHEFAAGMTTDNPHYGATKNPWSIDRIPGGSSGGSAASVAAGMCAVSIGTDTGGSVRIPAALSGVVGMRPTYGRLSRFGLVLLSWSLDQPGVLARSVADCELVYRHIAGRDPSDPSTSRQPVLAAQFGPGGIDPRQVSVGIPTEFYWERLSDDVRRAFDHLIEQLREIGCSIESVDLPNLPNAAEAQATIGCAETASTYPDLVERTHLLGDDVVERLTSGRHISAVDYLNAQRARRALMVDLGNALSSCDVLVCPATATTAIPLGADGALTDGQWRGLVEIYAHFTGPFSLTGSPVVVVPIGFDSDQLPIGAQVVGRAFADHRALEIGALIEGVLGISGRQPDGLSNGAK